MTSSVGEKKAKRRFRDWFKSKDFQTVSIRGTDGDQNLGSASVSASQLNIVDDAVATSPSTNLLDIQSYGSISPSPAPSSTHTGRLRVTLPMRSSMDKGPNITSNPATQSTVEEDLETVTSLATQSNIKEGLGIAGRFIQTLLKKLPDCVDGNPIKVALTIVKTIIIIKDEIGDNKDALSEGLESTRMLLNDAIGKVELDDSEDVKREIEKYKRKIDEQNTQLLQITRELDSRLRHLDYENYKKKINIICKTMDETTMMFMLSMQIEIRKTTAKMHEQMKEEQKARLTKSLKDLNPSHKADHRTVLEGQTLKRETCTEGTRVKILEEITDWVNDCTANSPRVFWLTGQAGSGKTTIAYTIAKRFEKGQATILGANFLCSRQFEETRSANRLLPTIAFQLAHKCGPYETKLHVHVPDKSTVVNHDISEQMLELLVEPWGNANHSNDLPTYLIIIDALDEISESGGSKFLSILLTTINEQHCIGLKFFVTSRTDPRIVELCDTFESKAICRLQDVPIDDAEADVERYLDAKLPNLAGSPDLAELRSRASGLFIYAATAVRILTTSRSITYKEQMRRLSNLLSKPSSLSAVGKDKSPIDGLYEQILYEAFSGFTDEEDLAPRLRILFTFLCAAERISTSIAAILMDDDDELARAVLNDLHAVLYIQDDRVFWYHASFPDFLLLQNRSNFRLGDDNFNFWCNEAVHHTLLTASCFRIMESDTYGLRFNMGDITSSYFLDSEHVDELFENVNSNISPVLQYSSLHWAHHLSLMPLDQGTDDICSYINYISEFLQIRVLFWIEAMNLLGSSAQCTPMLHQARRWLLSSPETTDTKSALALDLLECADFATHFAGSPAAESTPHLYISSLATWKGESSLSKKWKSQFSRLPAFTHASGGHDLPLLTIRTSATIRVVAFSNNGTRIVSGSDDQCARIWDASTGKELKVLRGHTESVRSAAFSSDDKWIVSGSGDYTLRVWDVSTGECLKVLGGHIDSVKSVATSKNGLWIASGSCDESVRLWDIATGDVVKVMVGHTGSVNSVAFSANGAWLASGSDDCSVRIWDTSNGGQLRVLNDHTNSVTSVAFSADGSQIVSGSWDCSIRLWNAAAGEKLRELRSHNFMVNSVAFSGNDAWIVSGSDDTSVQLWDTSTGETWKVLKGHTGNVYSIASSVDATRVVSGSVDGSVRMWNVVTQTELSKIKGDAVPVTSVASSMDGTQIISGSSDGSVRVWDATIYRELQVLKISTQPVNSVTFSDSATHIACGSGNNVWVKDVTRDAEVKILLGHTQQINSIAFSGNESLIVSASEDMTVRLWDISKGVQLKVVNASVELVVFSQDGQHILSVSSGGFVRVWDMSGKNVLKFIPRAIGGRPSHSWVALSSDAARIVTSSYRDMIMTVRDTSTSSTLTVLKGHTKIVHVVVFSHDGAYIVSGSSDKTVRVWNVSTGKEIAKLQGRHTDAVHAIAISSDGRSIISGSDDGSAIIWGMDIPAWYLDLEATGWILSSSTNDRLMWVSPDAPVLPRSNCRVFVGESNYSSIKFDNSMIGLDWSQCYTPANTTH